ncbi:hypothetical protein TCT1_01400 [Xenorhabdus sp. TCT-1]|uniref:Uncharacterized protein n=1 Tax=Xenorhabdus taiwanensis TaxID=3085177 RepID=A0ABM8JR88_9GAMM|nr:hypothetical protein TCT1_01400 [Xenorhabdus sp. TCT-1]
MMAIFLKLLIDKYFYRFSYLRTYYMHAAWQNAATTSNAKMLLFYTLWLQSEINVRCITLEGGN